MMTSPQPKKPLISLDFSKSKPRITAKRNFIKVMNPEAICPTTDEYQLEIDKEEKARKRLEKKKEREDKENNTPQIEISLKHLELTANRKVFRNGSKKIDPIAIFEKAKASKPIGSASVRGDKKDPLSKFLIDQGIPYEDDLMQPDNTVVFSFPMKSPAKAVLREDLSAVTQLENWKNYQENWCEHKPSVTISVKEDEWFEVGSWVYDNFKDVAGVSFLPHSDHTYKQAPYQDITKEEYLALSKKMPRNVDWTLLSDYEQEDNTTGTQELACSAGACEIVDIT